MKTIFYKVILFTELLFILVLGEEHAGDHGGSQDHDSSHEHGGSHEKSDSHEHSAGHHFGYDEENGPEKWGGICNSGSRQSPIDIRAPDIDIESFSRIHFVNYARFGQIKLKNNGHTLIAEGFEKWGDNRPYLYGGGLKGKYDLVQFHFHWSQANYSGSEHTIAHLHYPAEIHLVHVKRGRSLDDGKPLEEDTIAVVGIFVAIGNDGTSLSAITPSLNLLAVPERTTVLQSFQLMPLLPANLETFYRYEGSLTTPGCNEAVIWTLMTEPISMTATQLTMMRQTHLSSGKMGHNYRPTQPLYGRRIQFRAATFYRDRNSSSTVNYSILVLTISFLVKLFL